MNIKTWTRRRKIVVSGAAAFLALSVYGNTVADTETTASDPAPTQSVAAPEPTSTPEPTVAPTSAPEPTVAPTSTPEPTTVPDPMVAAGWARATGDCDALSARYMSPLNPNTPGARQVVILDTLQLRGRELGCGWAMEDLGSDLSSAETEPLSIASRVDD